MSKGKGKPRKSKINVVFNEEKRREFLTGFHKRKLQRKKKAKENLEQALKEERKRIKAEAKESYKKLVKSHTPIPELEHLLSEEYNDEDVNVKIVELSTSEIAEKNNWIGANQPAYESDEPASEDEEDTNTSEVPGMELRAKRHNEKKEVVEKKARSKQDVKRIVKRQATKTVKKSKAFQLKNKLEQQKQKKQALYKRNLRFKLQKKNARKKGGQNRS